MELRTHQSEIIDRARGSFLAGKRRVIIQASTGAGKTVIAASIASAAVDKGGKILFLCHRRELCYQARDRFEAFGLTVGLILAGEKPDLAQKIQIATIQTYSRRIALVDQNDVAMWVHDANLIIVDECHTGISPTYQKVLLELYENNYCLGLTATPCRGDGKGLGEYFDEILSAVSFKCLIDQGFLVPYRYYAPAEIDLDKIKTVAGDYDKKELGRRMNNVRLVGDILNNWLKYAGGRQTIIFAVNVKHSLHIQEVFTSNGISCEHIDARTPHEERAQVLADLESGFVQVVTNVGILTEGFDCPVVSCIVIARPTKSYGLFIQMAGRGSRPYGMKENCILLDHGGCLDQHGTLEDDVEWSLEGRKLAWKKKEREEKEKSKSKCTFCGMIFESRDTCPDCGSPVKSFGKKVEAVDAELVEITGGKKMQMADKRRVYGMALYYTRSKGWKNGAVAHTYRDITGVWPRGMDFVAPIKPDMAFLNYMRHLQIKKAKMREANDRL
jgi:DNA repair protein RadD